MLHGKWAYACAVGLQGRSRELVGSEVLGVGLAEKFLDGSELLQSSEGSAWAPAGRGSLNVVRLGLLVGRVDFDLFSWEGEVVSPGGFRIGIVGHAISTAAWAAP